MVTFTINASTKSLVERLCDFKIYAISVLSFIGSVCAPDKATLKTENHALECTTAGPYNATPSNLLGVGSVCGLGPDLASTIELPHVRPRLDKASRKSKRPVGTIALLFSLCLLTGRKNFLAPSMACSTAHAFDIVCSLDRDGELDEAPQKKKQKVVTGLLRDKLYVQACKVLGPISRYRVADILLHMKLVSGASRPGLTVGVLRILCMDYAQLKDFTLKSMIIRAVLDARVNPTLSLITTSAFVCTKNVYPFWGQAAVLPRRNHLLHDFITRVFLRSLQYGITVMGFIDAFVDAHHQHRQCIENPGKFGDCMKGRIRLKSLLPTLTHIRRRV